MTIRQATTHDIESITDIYNDAVLTTTAIWNETTVTTENRLNWLHQHQKCQDPVLVITDTNNTVLGYATFGAWRPFEGYRHTVEHSIYIDKKYRGQGLGKKLLTALIEQARLNNKHVMIAGIESNNTASISLHEKMNFVKSGLMLQVGTKFGQWLDLTFLQIIL